MASNSSHLTEREKERQQAFIGSGRFRLYKVHPEELEHAFGMCRDWMEEALLHGRGEYLLSDIFYAVQEKNMFMAILLDMTNKRPVAFTVLQVVVFPRKKNLHVVLGGGERPAFNWIPSMLASYDEVAIKIGADAITGYTYPELARLSKRYGYVDWYSMVGKELRRESTH